jgi:Rieske Fe-S protein
MRSYDTGRAARFPNQAQLHPRRYLEGLADAIERLGGLVFTGPGGPHVVEMHGGHGARVHTRDGRTVHASAIVLATNSPILDRVVLHTKQAPYRTYVVALRVPRGSVERALYWDTADPYHYVRTHALDDLHDLLIVGGEDHKAGMPDDPEARFERLRAWTRARFPSAGAVEHAWSGLVYEPNDGLAFIGRNPLDADNVYVCTGDSGQGTTHGTIAGLLITDVIQGRANPWIALYDPGRVRLSSSSLFAYARENADVAGRYAQRLLGVTAPGEVADVAQVRPGEAAIVRHDGHPLAVYRDVAGALHARSAVCTHLGCVVGWNGAEKRWECPCHGSRFAATGEVINGPATEDLARPGGVEAVEPTERVPAGGVREPEPAK